MSKRLYSFLTIGSVLAGTLYVVACGGSSSGKKVDAKIVGGDGKMPDAKPCSAKATYTPSFGTSQVAKNMGSGSGYTQKIEWQGALSTAPEVFVDLRAYSGGGSNTSDWPSGNVTPKSNIDLTTTNDVIVIIGANLNGSGVAQDIYFATAGTVNLTTVTPTFAGNANGLSFTHIDSTGNPAPDGCMSSISSMSWSTALTFQGKDGSELHAVPPAFGWPE